MFSYTHFKLFRSEKYRKAVETGWRQMSEYKKFCKPIHLCYLRKCYNKTFKFSKVDWKEKISFCSSAIL